MRAFQLTQNASYAEAAARCLDFIVPFLSGPDRHHHIILGSVHGDKVHRNWKKQLTRADGEKEGASDHTSSRISDVVSRQHWKGYYWMFVAMEYDRATGARRYATIANGIARQCIDKLTYGERTVYNINQGAVALSVYYQVVDDVTAGTRFEEGTRGNLLDRPIQHESESILRQRGRSLRRDALAKAQHILDSQASRDASSHWIVLAVNEYLRIDPSRTDYAEAAASIMLNIAAKLRTGEKNQQGRKHCGKRGGKGGDSSLGGNGEGFIAASRITRQVLPHSEYVDRMEEMVECVHRYELLYRWNSGNRNDGHALYNLWAVEPRLDRVQRIFQLEGGYLGGVEDACSRIDHSTHPARLLANMYIQRVPRKDGYGMENSSVPVGGKRTIIPRHIHVDGYSDGYEVIGTELSDLYVLDHRRRAANAEQHGTLWLWMGLGIDGGSGNGLISPSNAVALNKSTKSRSERTSKPVTLFVHL